MLASKRKLAARETQGLFPLARAGDEETGPAKALLQQWQVGDISDYFTRPVQVEG